MLQNAQAKAQAQTKVQVSKHFQRLLNEAKELKWKWNPKDGDINSHQLRGGGLFSHLSFYQSDLNKMCGKFGELNFKIDHLEN